MKPSEEAGRQTPGYIFRARVARNYHYKIVVESELSITYGFSPSTFLLSREFLWSSGTVLPAESGGAGRKYWNQHHINTT